MSHRSNSSPWGDQVLGVLSYSILPLDTLLKSGRVKPSRYTVLSLGSRNVRQNFGSLSTSEHIAYPFAQPDEKPSSLSLP
jgi:hypothetical protein